MAAIHPFQVDLDKPWNYLRCRYEKAPPPPLPPFWKGRGQCLVMPRLSPASLRTWVKRTRPDPPAHPYPGWLITLMVHFRRERLPPFEEGKRQSKGPAWPAASFRRQAYYRRKNKSNAHCQAYIVQERSCTLFRQLLPSGMEWTLAQHLWCKVKFELPSLKLYAKMLA